MHGLKFTQGVQGVTGPIAVHFTRIHHHLGQVLEMQTGHGQTMDGGAQRPLLVPCVTRGHHIQHIQRKLIDGGLSQPMVRHMGWVKGATVKTDTSDSGGLQIQSLGLRKSV